MTFREKYINEMDSVTFSSGFEVRTANLMMQKAERKDEKVLPKRKPVKVLAVAIAIIALLSTVAFAVSYYLSAKPQQLFSILLRDHFRDRKHPQSISDKKVLRYAQRTNRFQIPRRPLQEKWRCRTEKA